MQTFLPYPDYRESARVIDNKRLGKQRVECLQILNKLLGLNTGRGWTNHPAVRMWRGHEYQLVHYSLEICHEWKGRGFNDTVEEKILSLLPFGPGTNLEKPFWIGDPAFHSAHRAILLAKDFEWYKQFGWEEKPAVKNEKGSYPYVWPV